MSQVEAGIGALIRALNRRAEVFDLDDLRFDFYRIHPVVLLDH